MNAHDLKVSAAQVRAAKKLIAQFEDGTGRHNSNLAAAGRDAQARVTLDGICAYVDRRIDRWIRGQWDETGNEARLKEMLHARGILRSDPLDCAIGQVVPLSVLADYAGRNARWVRIRRPRSGFDFWNRDMSMVASEIVEWDELQFERVRYCLDPGPHAYRVIEREFWKRVA